MATLSRQAIVGDIGHTNIRFALADIDELTITNLGYFSTPMFTGPAEALAQFLRTIPERPEIVSIAVAGPVVDGKAHLNGPNWSFSAADFAPVIDARVHLVSGATALAGMLPHLVAHDVHRIGSPAEAPGNRLVISIGSALEVAVLVPSGAAGLVLASRAAEARFPIGLRDDLPLLESMYPDAPRLTADDVLSTRGLVALARAIGRGAPPRHAAEIVRAAFEDSDPPARRALDQFAGWLGGFAGDLALVSEASGGVYIAGGMASPLLALLQEPAFRAAFDAEGSAAAFLRAVPVHVITASDVVLRGAALAASHAARRGPSTHRNAAVPPQRTRIGRLGTPHRPG